MSDRNTIARLVARLTGRLHLERLAALDEKVGRFGRAHREDLAAQRRELDEVKAAVSARATAAALNDLHRRVEELQRSFAHQDRAFAEAFERVRLIDEQGMDDRRFARRIAELLRHDRPVIVGPWTGEVGFELLYWIPFVRWVLANYGISPDRLLVVSRGGVSSWYRGLGTRYAEVFSFFTPAEFRAATEDRKKQRRVGAFDAEVVKRVVARHGLGRADLLHPGMMYRLLMHFWRDLATIARVEKYGTYARITADADPVLAELPRDYVATRFYFSDCFPDTAANRAFVSATLESLSRDRPVVVLNPPFAVDDHRDLQPAGGRVISIGGPQMPLERNLAVQTAVIARASAFVGTYGGYSYLAPFCGVPALAFYSDRTFKVQHLHVAQRALDRLGGPSLVPMHVGDLPVVQLLAKADRATCPACDGAQVHAVADWPMDRRGRAMACDGCGLLFVHPQPKDLASHYAPDGLYRAKRPVTAPPERIPAHGVLLAALDRHFPASHPTSESRVLDFGCGNGKWLNTFLDHGWETFGVEPSTDVAFTRHQRLETVPHDERFDFVMIHHVLEHLPRPLDTLRDLARALKPGGYCLVSVPRIDAIAAHRDVGYCLQLRSHIVAFTEACLTFLLAQAGLGVVEALHGLDAALTHGRPTSLRLLAQKGAPARPGEAPAAALQRVIDQLPEILRACDAAAT